MCNRLLRALLGLSIGVVLASGTALARTKKGPSNKPVTKAVATTKNGSPSKDGAARRARIKKIGSAAAPKETPKSSSAAKATKPSSHAGTAKKNHPTPAAHAQMATNSDGGSVSERRARIHTMRVPE